MSQTLSEYIRALGVEKVARKLGFKERRVKSWMHKERFPRKEDAELIVRKTPVSYEGIYGARARAKT